MTLVASRFAHDAITQLDHFGDVVFGIDVQQRPGQALGMKRLPGKRQHDEGILAARDENGRTCRLRGNLAQDEAGFAAHAAYTAARYNS